MSKYEEELPPKTGKNGANTPILDEDSSVEYRSKEEENTKLYTKEEDDMGQSIHGHNVNEAEAEENQDELQEEQDDDNEETEKDDDDKGWDTSGQFDDEHYEVAVFIQEDVLCSMQHKAEITTSRILLDGQSSVDISCNAKMLTIIHYSKRYLVMRAMLLLHL